MATSKPQNIIHWFRRDLRITDNQSLHHAAGKGLPVIPVYFLSGWRHEHQWTGPKRQHFLCECLRSLAQNLETIQGRLIVCEGNPIEGLRNLIRNHGVAELHFNADPDPHGKKTESGVFEMCAELGVVCVAHHDVTIHRPQEVLTLNAQPYKVYTPYSRNWLSLEKKSPLGKAKQLNTPQAIPSLPLPSVTHWGWQIPKAELPEAGERAARVRLKRAVADRIQTYADKRDLPAVSGTSRLSQDLRFGLLSPRTVYHEAMKACTTAGEHAKTSINVFVKELAWREFYFAILHFFPNVMDEEFNAEWRGLSWDEPDERFHLWKEGRTGFPIVDAGMRELLATGFMHNRVRMITAMFLTKDLHLDWKLGESYFMQQLLDGEIASNNGGWQWSAGTGADAAPYFRIQNPWSQTARFDPKGIYIKRWLPELAHVSAERFLDPPKDGRSLAPGYPLPCLDHKTERERTLAIFKKHRSSG